MCHAVGDESPVTIYTWRALIGCRQFDLHLFTAPPKINVGRCVSVTSARWNPGVVGCDERRRSQWLCLFLVLMKETAVDYASCVSAGLAAMKGAGQKRMKVCENGKMRRVFPSLWPLDSTVTPLCPDGIHHLLPVECSDRCFTDEPVRFAQIVVNRFFCFFSVGLCLAGCSSCCNRMDQVKWEKKGLLVVEVAGGTDWPWRDIQPSEWRAAVAAAVAKKKFFFLGGDFGGLWGRGR